MQLLITAFVLSAATFCLSLATEECVEIIGNNETYRYTICTGTQAMLFDSSRKFCQENLGDGYDLVTFSNKEQFDFLHAKLRETVDSSYTYFPGIYQEANFSDRRNPQTGNYFWINDPKNKITNESSSYWKPFEDIIIGFEMGSLQWRLRQTFVLNVEGELLPGQTLGGEWSLTPVNGSVVCQKLNTIIAIPSGSQASADVFIVLNLIIGLVYLL